jgi:hypothetical protein
MDPFLKVVCYPEGITPDNLEDFLTRGGKLDMLVDECDSVDVKIQCRVRARALRIPMLMETSDRGLVDVERFDLEPDRPLLHGLIDGIAVSDYNSLTDAEKIPIIGAMVGLATLSDRMKASLQEVGKTIRTWPQLASAVALGGGIGADICRRIALGQYHESGRYYVDLEQIIGDKSK